MIIPENNMMAMISGNSNDDNVLMFLNIHHWNMNDIEKDLEIYHARVITPYAPSSTRFVGIHHITQHLRDLKMWITYNPIVRNAYDFTIEAYPHKFFLMEI